MNTQDNKIILTKRKVKQEGNNYLEELSVKTFKNNMKRLCTSSSKNSESNVPKDDVNEDVNNSSVRVNSVNVSSPFG